MDFAGVRGSTVFILAHYPQLGSPVHGLRPSQPRLIIFLNCDWSGLPIPAAKTPDLGTLNPFESRIYSLGVSDCVAFFCRAFSIDPPLWEALGGNGMAVPSSTKEADFLFFFSTCSSSSLFLAPKSHTCRFFQKSIMLTAKNHRVSEFAPLIPIDKGQSRRQPVFLVIYSGGHLPLGSASFKLKLHMAGTGRESVLE